MENPQYIGGNIAGLLKELSDGSRAAMDKFILLVIKQLRQKSHLHPKKAPKNHTFQTIQFVFRAYLRLVDPESVSVQSRAQFIGIGSVKRLRVLQGCA